MAEDSRHEGVQRKVWMPDDMNTTVEMLAASGRKPVSAVMRELMAAGLQSEAQNEAMVLKMAEAITTALMPVMSRLEHLERLVFYTAESAGLAAENLVYSAQKQGQKLHPDDPEQAAEVVKNTIGRYQGMTHEKIRKALRGPKPKLTEEDN